MGANDRSLLQRHLLTVDDYHRMAEAGVLAPDARVELIEGELIAMAPQTSLHACTVNTLVKRLTLALADRAMLACQTPVRLSPHTEPEPDLMLLRPRDDAYALSHPGPADVLLLIEVADTSVRYDREVKLPLYALHGVAEVWIVDLQAGLLRTHRRPHADAYLETNASRAPGVVTLPGLPDVEVDLSGLLR